jgi:hypothetical protein
MPPQHSVDIWGLSDLCTPWCLHVVATLRIADHLVAGKTTIDDLATASGTHADSLRRVMKHLVAKGVFEETAAGLFALNAPARALLEPPLRLGLDLDGIGGRMAYAWGSLLSAVRTGSPAYQEVFGLPFWEDLQAHPDIGASFDALMGIGHGTPDPNVLVEGDWDSVRTVVDVGGGTGTLLAQILRARPNISGILVDLPSTVARASEIFQAAAVSERVTLVGQSFFDPLPAAADLYLLKSVLADWPDREAIKILKRCGEAAAPAGRVVVLGGISPDEPSPALLMMVLVGGRERSLAEFRQLADAAGLGVRVAGRQPSGRSVVECQRQAV